MAPDTDHPTTTFSAGAALDLTVSTDDDSILVMPRGEIDMASAPILVECLDSAADCGRPIVADLSGVSFMDSTGLRTLLEVQRKLAARGLGLSVRNPTRQVHQIFTISGVGELFGLTA